jgi:hypothetical protein
LDVLKTKRGVLDAVVAAAVPRPCWLNYGKLRPANTTATLAVVRSGAGIIKLLFGYRPKTLPSRMINGKRCPTVAGKNLNDHSQRQLFKFGKSDL